MNKILNFALISTVALVLTTGCSSKGGVYNEASSNALITKMHNNEKIIDAIIKAGQKANWKITEFKSNEVIAEKIGDGKTVSTSVRVHDGYIEFSNNSETSDLRDAIEDELQKQKKAH